MYFLGFSHLRAVYPPQHQIDTTNKGIIVPCCIIPLIGYSDQSSDPVALTASTSLIVRDIICRGITVSQFRQCLIQSPGVCLEVVIRHKGSLFRRVAQRIPFHKIIVQATGKSDRTEYKQGKCIFLHTISVI